MKPNYIDLMKLFKKSDMSNICKQDLTCQGLKQAKPKKSQFNDIMLL